MAWEALVGSVDAARQNKQQVVETEHLMKALLEQKNGLARRIFSKAGIDNTTILQATDQFIYQQPKVYHTQNLNSRYHVSGSIIENLFYMGAGTR